MSVPEVKKEKLDGEVSDEERLGATQANLVCLCLRSGEKPITLVVKGETEELLYYRMGMNVRFKFLMMDYCERKGFGFGTINFIDPDGKNLKESESPQDLDLEDGDIIDALFHQMGG